MLLISGSLRQLRVSLLLFPVTLHVTKARPSDCVPAHSASGAMFSIQCWFCEACSAQSRTTNLSPSLPKSTLEANLLALFLLAWVGEAKKVTLNLLVSVVLSNTGPLWVPSIFTGPPPPLSCIIPKLAVNPQTNQEFSFWTSLAWTSPVSLCQENLCTVLSINSWH